MSKWGEWIVEKGQKTKYFPVHKYQLEVLHSKARFTAAISGSGGGKTAIGALWLMQQIQANPMGKFLIVAPTYSIFRSATKPTWEATVDGYRPLMADYKPAYNQYDLPTGGIIYCRSADNSQSFEGVQATAAWVDEAGQMTVSAWDAIKRRTNYRMGRVLLTTTPYSFNWLYNDFFAKYRAGDKNYHVVQWASIENPTFDAGEFERLSQTEAQHKFKMFYCGQFERAAGIVYPGLEECITDTQNVPQGKLVGGIDFGYNDYFATVAGVLDYDNCLWLFFERYKRQATISDHAHHLPKQVTYWADNARPDSIKELKRLGFYVRPAKKNSGSIQYGISLVTRRINSGKLKILKGTCTNLLQEAENYRYADSEEAIGSSGDIPVGGNDHALDALRYLIIGIDRKKVF